MNLNSSPDNHFIYHIIAMYQDISETNNPMMPGDMFQNVIINSLDTVKRLSNNLEVPFDGSLRNRTILKSLKIYTEGKALYFFCRL